MANITHDAQRAYKIPNDKRDAYFRFIDVLIEKAGIRSTERIANAIDASSDPIVIFNFEEFKPLHCQYIENMMKLFGAKDLTEELSEA